MIIKIWVVFISPVPSLAWFFATRYRCSYCSHICSSKICVRVEWTLNMHQTYLQCSWFSCCIILRNLLWNRVIQCMPYYYRRYEAIKHFSTLFMQLFHWAQKNAEYIVPLYCFDPRHYVGTYNYNLPKTGPFRLHFLLQSIRDLRNILLSKGRWLTVYLRLYIYIFSFCLSSPAFTVLTFPTLPL